MATCRAHSASGNPCRQNAITGGTVCVTHGGRAPKVKSNAAVRAEVMRWTLGEATDDPGETLLRLITQSRMRADAYADELAQLVQTSPNLREALVGEVWISPEHADRYKAGEYIRGLAELEAQERDRCANFCRLAIAAGLEERRVRATERQAAVFERALQLALADAGLDEAGRREVASGVARHLRLQAG